MSGQAFGRAAWLEVTVPAAAAAVDAVAAACTDLGSPGVRVTDDGVVAYFAPAAPDGARRILADLQRRLDTVGRAFGPGVVGAPSASLLDEEDWAEGWKRHWRPQPVGRRLVVVPSWLRESFRAAPGRIPLWIDPGMAFGTGEHASTRLSLVQLEQALDRLIRPIPAPTRPLRILDVGTGSGILAVAAAHLARASTPPAGADVWACDHDELAVRIARENAAVNGVQSVIRIEAADILDPEREPALPGGADLILANILYGVLYEAAPRLVRAARPGGLLLLAGITTPQREALAARYEERGCRVLSSVAVDGWAALLLRRGGGNTAGTAGGR